MWSQGAVLPTSSNLSTATHQPRPTKHFWNKGTRSKQQEVTQFFLSRLDDPTKSQGILIGQGGKKTSGLCNGRQKGAITMLPKPELQKTSPYSYHFRKAKKKGKQKSTTPLACYLSLMFVPRSSFPQNCNSTQVTGDFHSCTRDRQMDTGQDLASAHADLT